jgi:hypothetical protein
MHEKHAMAIINSGNNMKSRLATTKIKPEDPKECWLVN